MRTVLVIGGTDSAGAAGVAADLRALHALGIHGTTAVVAVTAQDTLGLQGAWDLPVEAVRAQLASVLDDVGADAVKTGMLSTAATVAAVCERLPHGTAPLVVDPVGVSTTGHPLLAPDAVDAVRDLLLPRATVVTPNLAEVEQLTGVAVRDEGDLRRGAAAVLALGPRWVLVTGGHLAGEPTDLLTDGSTEVRLSGPRVVTDCDRGTGCTLATALAGRLALGDDVPTAAARAKDLVTAGLRAGYRVGAGRGVLGVGLP